MKPIRDYAGKVFYGGQYLISRSQITRSIADFSISVNVDTFEDYMNIRHLHDEEPVLNDMLNELGKSDIMWDVGAKIGVYGLFAADKIQKGSVIVFEPDPSRVSKVISNNSMNTQKVDIFNIALGNESGYSGFHKNKIQDENTGYMSRIERGDKLVEDGFIKQPTIMKIDVEGAEGLVLSGLKDSLSESIRIIYCEVHPNMISSFGMSEDELWQMLEDFGFEGEIINTPRKTGDAYVSKFER